jgi:hypothetical protein
MFIRFFSRRHRVLGAVWLLLSTLGTCPSLAQRSALPDYAVTQTGDTLRGYIRERSNETIAFKTTAEGTETTYDVSQLSRYFIDGVLRESAEWFSDTLTGTRRRAFLRLVTPGYVTLFRLGRAESLPKDNLVYLLRLSDGTYVPLEGRAGWLMLNRKLIECDDPTLLRLLDVSQFSNTLPYYERVVRQYNQCVRPGEKVSRPREPFRWALGLMGGASLDFWIRGNDPGSLLFGDPNGPYTVIVSPRIGPQLSFILSKRVAVQVEGYYGRYRGTRSTAFTYSLGEAQVHHRVAESFVTVPITLQYALTDRTLRWYLRAGLMPLRKFDTQVWMRRDDGTTLGTENLMFVAAPRTNLGFVLGSGVETRLTNGRRARLELRGTLRSSDRAAAALAMCPSIQLLGGIDLLGSRR